MKTTSNKVLITEKMKSLKEAKSLIILIGAILIFIAPLIHIYFSKTNIEVEKYKKQLNQSASENINKLELLEKSFKVGETKPNVFYKEFYQLSTLINKAENTNSKLITKSVNDHRIFGWKTTRVFLIGLGIRLPYLLYSLLISFLIYKIKTEDKNLKKSFILLQVLSFSSAFYQLLWVFWYSQDYPLATYRYALIGFSIVAAISTVYFIIHKEVFKNKLLVIVKSMSRFIIKDAKQYIDPKKEKEYIKGYFRALEKGME